MPAINVKFGMLYEKKSDKKVYLQTFSMHTPLRFLTAFDASYKNALHKIHCIRFVEKSSTMAQFLVHPVQIMHHQITTR